MAGVKLLLKGLFNSSDNGLIQGDSHMYQTIEQSVSGSFVDFASQQIIQPNIGHGEHIIWAGQPRQGMFLQVQDIFMIPFSFAWGGFAIFWTYMAWGSGAPSFMALFGLPFVAVGLYLMLGRFIFDARSRAGTYYGVTDQRILFVRSRGKAVTSLELRSVKEITLTENARGRGTILFGATLQSPPYARSAVAINRSAGLVPMFVQISRAKEVYEQIHRAQEALQTAYSRPS
jgi:hypothetical protein